MVHEKIAHQILKKEFFFGSPFNKNDSEVDKIIKTTSDFFCLPQNYKDENVGNDKDK